MKSRAVFVSDIHISQPSDERCHRFLRLLDEWLIDPPQHIFLVGDIFDLWISDRRYFVDRYEAVLQKLKRLSVAGSKIHYFEGNHDLDLGDFWAREMNADVYRQSNYFQLYGKTVRVEHGDQMDPSDYGYLFLRWFLRTPIMKFLARHLPDAIVKWIGERSSRASRSYTTQIKTISDDTTLQKVLAHAEKAVHERPFDVLISGHVHVPIDKTHNNYRVINLGTWLKEPLVLQIDPNKIEIVRINSQLV